MSIEHGTIPQIGSTTKNEIHLLIRVNQSKLSKQIFTHFTLNSMSLEFITFNLYYYTFNLYYSNDFKVQIVNYFLGYFY